MSRARTSGAWGRRAACVLLALQASACTSQDSLDAPVSTAQMTALHTDLKGQQFPKRFSAPAGAFVTGCAERRLGAERTDQRVVVYLTYVCGTWPTRCAASTTMSTGVAGPAVAHLEGVKIERWQFPGDGDEHVRNVKSWFPKPLRDAAFFPGNTVRGELMRAARRDSGCTG